MRVTNQGDVSVYTVAGANTSRPLPDWLARRRKRSLKADAEYQNRVELLQDFEFEEASQCVRVSDDNNWIMSTGTYKPQIHVHYLPHLSLSFARHTTSLNTTFLLLSSDYSKSIHLQSDRKLEFHTPAGLHFETRLPRYGRDLVYDRHSTEAVVPAVGLGADGHGEAFRMNLEVGRFMRSYQIDIGADEGAEKGLQGSIFAGSVNVAAIAEDSHGLLAFGTSLGSVEFFDPRSKSRVAVLGGQESEVTALDFSPTGLSISAGTSNGIVKVFDLRSPRPLLQKDHGAGFPIKTLRHLTTASGDKKMLSSDKQMIKIFDELDGTTWTSIEPVVDINHVEWCKGSGMLLTANEGSPMHSFFIPQLGPAPRWCSFLDTITEEMAEEISTDNYENFKFLTMPELKSLSLAHLVGKTNLLRPYMHGYFVASKLYEQARLIANPYAVEEERTKRIKEKMEKERASRIRGNKKVKVNQKLVDKLLKRQERRAEVDTKAGVLGDERFSKLFEDEEFKIDETSKVFQSLNPSTKVDGQADEQVAHVGSSDQSDGSRNDSDDGDSSGDGDDYDKASKKKKNDEVVMRVSSSNKGRHLEAKDTALGSRIHKASRISKPGRGDVVGERQVTFVPESRKKKTEEVPQEGRQDRRSDPRRSASANVFRRL
ncbi:WD40 repeat-like protein [Xylariomycetidae sp. FL2044]|nr:WD40 repeat-like protein [Xylariomycetidae sp. FL2044]